jgi:tRNA1Val (adenine37-N6)-methyltransferase
MTDRIAAEPGPGETRDAFFYGRIRIIQKKKGYRFSVDAVLLADFVEIRPGDVCLELGTGNGIVSLLLSVKPFGRVTGLEIQPDLAELARRNVLLNRLGDRIEILTADLRDFRPPAGFDVVFSNPPYFRRRGGVLSPCPEKSIAKHEIACDISDIMRKTRECLKADGRAYFIYPDQRRKDFMQAVEHRGLAVRKIRDVLARKDAPPKLFLAACGPGEERPEILPPLVLFGADGKYTAEAEAVFSGRIAF